MGEVQGESAPIYSGTRDTWVILVRPGFIPERKLPADGQNGLRDFLREVVECRPADTSIIIARLGCDGIDVESGVEWLSIFDRRWWRSHKRRAAKKPTTSPQQDDEVKP